MRRGEGAKRRRQRRKMERRRKERRRMGYGSVREDEAVMPSMVPLVLSYTTTRQSRQLKGTL